MPEQLTLEQRFGDGRAIDRDERLRRASAFGVDATGEQLFSRPRFTDQQHSYAAASGNLGSEGYCIADRLALAYDVGVPAFRGGIVRST